MGTVCWGQVSDHSQQPQSWTEVDVDDTADKAEVRRQVLHDGSFADPSELRLLSEGGAWRKWENCQTLPPGDLKVKVISRQPGTTTAFADDPLQKLSSNIEVQTHAVLRLGKAINSMASSFRAAKSNQFVYTPSNASRMRDPYFKLELIKAYQRSSYDEDEDKPCKTCKCMLLGVTLPTSYVTGSHLFKFKWHMAVQEVLGFSCINDTRNGLLLAKLCNVKLTDMKAYPWLKPPVQEKMAKESKQQDIMKDVTQALKESFGDIPTFAALQGKQLQFEGYQRPFKRCLAFQASQSRHSALSQGRISPSAIPEIDASAWSHNSYLERIKDYLADPELQYQVGPIDRLDNISELDKLEDSG